MDRSKGKNRPTKPHSDVPNFSKDTLNRYGKTDLDWAFQVLRGVDWTIKKGQEFHRKNRLKYRRVSVGLSPLTVKYGSAANPIVRQRLRHLLIEAFGSEFFNGLTASELALVTIIDKRWWSSDRDFQFNLETASRQIRNFLQGRNYLGIWEFGNVLNVRAPDGHWRVISPHAHILVWGDSYRALRSALMKRNEEDVRFKAAFDGPPAIQVDQIPSSNDLIRVCGYMTKAPWLAYSAWAGFYRFKLSKVRNTFVGHFRLYEILDNFALSELMLAGGEGVDISKKLRAELRKRGIALTRN